MEPGRAEPPVLHAFLAQSFDGLRTEAHLAKKLQRLQFHRGGDSNRTDEGAKAAESVFRLLRISRKILDAVSLDFAAIPIDLDYRTETILRKAYVLADDLKIESPDLIQQRMPRE
jgi:hypothetical protein